MGEIESESMGKALIVTDLGFSEEAITDGVNGYKIKCGDTEMFRKQIIELWVNPELCKKMGECARADYISKYLPDDNYKQLIEIYKGVESF